jgi:hypothetical protein
MLARKKASRRVEGDVDVDLPTVMVFSFSQLFHGVPQFA